VVEFLLKFMDFVIELPDLVVVLVIVVGKSLTLLLELVDFLLHDGAFSLVVVALLFVFGALVFHLVQIHTHVFKGALSMLKILVEVVDFFLEFVNIVEHTFLVVFVLFSAVVLVLVLFFVGSELNSEVSDLIIIIVIIFSSLDILDLKFSVLGVESFKLVVDVLVFFFPVV
jgi:hypothetical protein